MPPVRRGAARGHDRPRSQRMPHRYPPVEPAVHQDHDVAPVPGTPNDRPDRGREKETTAEPDHSVRLHLVAGRLEPGMGRVPDQIDQPSGQITTKPPASRPPYRVASRSFVASISSTLLLHWFRLRPAWYPSGVCAEGPSTPSDPALTPRGPCVDAGTQRRRSRLGPLI